MNHGVVQCVDVQQSAQLMDAVNSMVQQSSSASHAAATALNQVNSRANQQADTNNPARNLESASRVLKSPDVFDSGNPGDYATWRRTFMNWLSFADQQMVGLIREVEQLDPGSEIETVDWDDQDFAKARRLYAILTSYLKGPALQASRNLERDRNGFKLWKLLANQFALSARQRTLALSQAISSFPVFGDKGVIECNTNLESLVREYESTAGKAFDRDIC